MKFIDYAEKLEAIKYMAEHRSTGSPLQLASRLNVSERTILRMVQQLRDHGYTISFDRFRNSYVMEKNEERIFLFSGRE